MSDHELEHELTFTGSLPFAIEWQDNAFPDSELDFIQQGALDVLQAIIGLDETVHAGHDGNEEQNRILNDIARLETKLNLVLEMLSDVLLQQNAAPHMASISMGTHQLGWRVKQTVHRPGEQGLVSIYLVPGLAKPLRLAVEVIEVKSENSHSLIITKWLNLSEQVKELIAKYIFVQHRKEIARQRLHQQ